MRITLFAMSVALAVGATAAAQEPPADAAERLFLNQVDFGVRATAYAPGSDEARFQRYRDVRDGPTFDRFRFASDKPFTSITLQADHVGYRDQRFFGSAERYSKVKASFEWNQVPLFYSQTVETLYNTSTFGTLVMADPIQSGIQNKTLTLNNALTLATPFDLRTDRDIATGTVSYEATRSVDLGVVVRSTHKKGEYPWGGSFGISNAIATELPVPVDHRTTDVGTSVEFANQRAHARLAYDGSFFRNNVTTLVWDNPARVTDSATAGPVQGRMALWPNSDMNTVSAAGDVNLARRTRASAYVAVGEMSNNAPLLPFTINTALASPQLSRPTADVTARVTTMNYQLTSRPANDIWLNVRYRQYDMDNRTVPFQVGNSVNYDTALVVANKASEPFSQLRHTFDADAAYSPTRVLSFKAGYTRENVDRTYRVIENTWEDIGRASLDVTGVRWLSVRGIYEHSQRRGSPVDEAELLSIGEQPGMRHYDISDRNQDRFSTVVMVIPTSELSLNGSVSHLRRGYPGAYFGMKESDGNVYSIGFDLVPGDRVSLGARYGYETGNALQASRSANPLPANTPDWASDPTQQFNDPRRDWTDDSADRTHTFDVSMDLLKLFPRTEVRVAYDFSRSRSTYVYGLAPNSVLAAPSQLTPVINELQHGTLDGRYFLTPRFAVGMVYWFDKYAVDDFALNPVSSLAQPATGAPTLMMLGYFYAPYTANSFLARVTYLW